MERIAVRTSDPIGRSVADRFGLAARGAVLLAVVALLFGSVWDTARAWWRPDAAPAERTFSPKIRSTVERELREEGVRVSPAVHELLGPLLTAWEQRPELQRLFSDARGLPDIPRLLDWAEPLPDSFSSAIVSHLGAIIELRSRLGILGKEQQVLPVLYWTLENRKRQASDLGGVITQMAEIWRERPEIRERFTTANQVDVRAFLQWVNTLPTTDPRFAAFYEQYYNIRQAILELDRIGRVNARR